MQSLSRRALLAIVAAASATSPFAAYVQASYPGQPIKLIVPFPPAGGTDTVARLISDKMQGATGWTFVIDNKAGAGGNIGMDALAKRKNDGLTLGMGALAVSSAKRLPVLPDTPTVAESGYKGFDMADWKMLLAPAGTSPELVKRVNAEVQKALGNPQTIAQLLAEGSLPMSGTPEQAAQFLKTEQQRWGALVRDANIKAD